MITLNELETILLRVTNMLVYYSTGEIRVTFTDKGGDKHYELYVKPKVKTKKVLKPRLLWFPKEVEEEYKYYTASIYSGVGRIRELIRPSFECSKEMRERLVHFYEIEYLPKEIAKEAARRTRLLQEMLS